MSEERTIVRGPNGEVWQEPPPNSPVQAKPGWLLKLQMDAANRAPIPAESTSDGAETPVIAGISGVIPRLGYPLG